ncbi:MAG: CapA family protein [Gemmatimonadota bacterium]|nr:CapA family protein [Gemmatimonadota bacterium]MDH3479858.1 CapA family protein [Gemmatimonadota bacterium]MDH5550223.1 CapA family protein [Gemmatimonadota bacterium]
MTRLNFYGDVCLQGIDGSRFEVDPALVELARRAALNVANLESPLTRSTEPMPYKSVHIKAEPERSWLFDLFDTFSLANNHVLDYREDGLLETMRFLDSAGKGHFGAGANRASAAEPLRVERDGQRFAFFGFCRWQNAGRASPGTAPDRIGRIARAVRRASEDGYFVVVYPHWNYEYIDYPAPANRRVAKRLIDAGAHLVVGSHPHVVQGFERHRGRMIYHSLGNFVFDFGLYSEKERQDPRIFETFVLSVDVRPDRTYETTLAPARTSIHGVERLRGDAAERLLARLETISRVLENDARATRSFYESATREASKVEQEMGTMIRSQGIMYLLSRLHRVRMQDLKIKLHTMRKRRREQRVDVSAGGPSC